MCIIMYYNVYKNDTKYSIIAYRHINKLMIYAILKLHYCVYEHYNTYKI